MEDRTVYLWDARTEPLAPLAHGSSAFALTLRLAGSRLAMGCCDDTVRLWDLESREEAAELRGHGDYVHAVAWSPDGTRLLSASGEVAVRVWDSVSPGLRARRP